MSEHRLVKRILTVLRTIYPKDVWYKIYTGPYQERGMPDIIGCHRGRFVGLEVKISGKKERGITAYQELQLSRIKRAKGITGIVSSSQEALDAIEIRKF